MTALEELKAFDVDGSDVTLWTFKKQSPKGSAPQFNGHWADTTDDLDEELKLIVKQQRSGIEEELDYGLLAQNNESSVLNISMDETHVGLLVDQFSAEIYKRKIRDVKTLMNCEFYVIKLNKDGKVLFSVKKTDSSWKTKSATNMVTALFKDKQLDVVHDDDFKIHKSIDFFGINDAILIKSKKNFESILSYKAAHELDYAEMSTEKEFIAAFDGLGEFTKFVGNNKIHLRRMSAIRQKGFYCDEIFMKNLRDKHKEFNLNINFDSQGRIVPTADTCRDIIAALLDHRLGSGFSGNIYDVPDATKV